MTFPQRFSSLDFWISTFLCVVAVSQSCDLIADYQENPEPFHFAVEIAVVISAISALIVLKRRAASITLENLNLKADLQRAHTKAEHWRLTAASHIEGLSKAIDTQLGAWGLTPSEADIARLLLKGLSLKEISGLRGTSERTVRQQAQGVYTKSGLSGRTELAAYFLEDLLAGTAPADSSDAPRPR